jgi:NADPH:quinone reductase-like Zn-dependent oxidoreductase
MTPLPSTRRAVVLQDFGDASRLSIETLPLPSISDDELLVRVRATSVNPIDWKMRKALGAPRALWRRMLGKPMILGIDFSGEVAAKGARVAEFEVGDEVMGAAGFGGAYAEYVVVRPSEKRTVICRKPPDIPHEAAAAVPFAGLVAYSGLVTLGQLKAPARESRIMIIGASGGVGHLAVQIARRGLGVRFIVGICSAKNADFVRECGAHDVVAYDETPISYIADERPAWFSSFDLIFDATGADAYWTEVADKLLAPGGRFVTAALPSFKPGKVGEDVGLLDGLALVVRLLVRHLGSRYRLVPGLIAGLPGSVGLPALVGWLRDGKLRPHVSASYDLEQMAEAHALSEMGRAVGKIAVRVA